MLWVKTLHIVFIMTWFADLFYLPRLFVYHAQATDRDGIERLKVMERKLFFGIMTPGAVLTVAFGLWLWLGYGVGAGTGWMRVKLIVVLLLIGYHVWCAKLLADFKHDRNTKGHVWYRWFNEAPTLMLFVAVILVVVKPF